MRPMRWAGFDQYEEMFYDDVFTSLRLPYGASEMT